MRLALLIVVALVTTACGQKGPLYLRDNPPPGIKPPKPEAYQPQPYPKEPAKESGEGDGAARK